MAEKTVLVLGGTGFLGSHIIDALLQDGYQVHAFQNDEWTMQKHQNLTLFTGDVCKKASLQDAFNDVDIVINTIGQMTSPEVYYAINTIGMLNILQHCVDRNVNKIIYTSSVKVYGKIDTTCTEKTVPRPMTQEGAMKLAAEYLHHYYSENDQLPVVCLRFANMYGPGQKKGVLVNFIQNIIKKETVTINGDGEQKRSFVFISDAVSAILLSLHYRSNGFEIFNIANETMVSINTFLDMVQKNLGTQVAIKYNNVWMDEENLDGFDATKAKKKLGYVPQVDLEKGLSLTCNSIKDTVV